MHTEAKLQTMKARLAAAELELQQLGVRTRLLIELRRSIRRRLARIDRPHGPAEFGIRRRIQ
jgi:hypothetical protein